MTASEAPARLLARHPGLLLSEVLREMQAGEGVRVPVADIVSALRDRSFAPLLLIFAAPNVFLFIPGSSVATAVPLMFLSVQLILGRPNTWLPRVIADRSIERAAFDRIVTVSVPYFERVERLAKPRWWPSSYLLAERAIGVATVVLAVFLFLPIPFANGLPALSIIMLAQRDGYWLTGGLCLSIISAVFVAGMVSVDFYALFDLILR